MKDSSSTSDFGISPTGVTLTPWRLEHLKKQARNNSSLTQTPQRRDFQGTKSTNPSTVPLPPGHQLCWAWWAVACLTVVAGFLRFWRLDHASLWGDEINFVLHSAQPTFKQYLDEYMGHFAPPNFPPHLPVATVIEFVVLRFGLNDFLGRFSAALLGTLTVPMAFVAARAMFDKATGLITAALATLSFFLIYYSREANYYAPLVFFSMSFLAVFWTFFSRAKRGERVPFWGLALVWLSGTILLQTHLAALLFVAAVGVAAALITFFVVREQPAKQRGQRFKNFIPLIMAYSASWVLVVPWVVWIMGLEPSLVDIPPHRQLTLANMMKLPAKMGWGNVTSMMAPAAILFWGCALAGVVFGLKERDSRGSVGTLAFVGIFIVAVFSRNVRTNGLSPHYLILTLIPLLFIVALGMRRIGHWVAARFNRGYCAAGIPAAALLGLAAFEVRPLQLLYQLPGKPTDWRGIAQWMSANLPKDTVVYFDWYVSVWQHVPTYYATPGITCTSTLPVGSADHMIQFGYRNHTRLTLLKHSDAAYLEAMKLFDVDPRFDAPELGGRKWQWPDQYFRRKKSFRNEPILELDRLGICPIALNYTTMGEVEPVLYYNTTEDIIAIHRELWLNNTAMTPSVFRRFETGFGHAKTQDQRDWRPAREDARFALHNLADTPRAVRVQLGCVAVRMREDAMPINQMDVSLEFEGKTVARFVAPMGKYIRSNAVEILVPPGTTSVRLVVHGLEKTNGNTLLVDDLFLEFP